MRQVTYLLDVDGVLNADDPGWSAPPRSGWAYSNGVSWRMRWAPQLMLRLRMLYRQPNVRLLWATSWCGQTRQLEELFKLPALDSARSVGMSVEDKQEAAMEVVYSGRHLIWADDEAIPLDGPLRVKLDAADSLLIAPKPNRGLRPEHLDQIDRYVLG